MQRLRSQYWQGGQFAISLGALLCTGELSSAQTDTQVALNLGNSFYTNNQTYTDSSLYAWPTATPASQGMNSAIFASGDAALGADTKTASFLVVRGDKLVHESYFNGVQAAQAKNIHSASKSILSSLTGIAIHDGLLSLDTKISDVLPQTIAADKQNITVRNLLTMTSGITWEEDSTEYGINGNFVQNILNLPQQFAPGTQFNYSSGDSYLLGAVLAEASGQSLHQYGKQHLFDPLGIDVERWGRDSQGYFSGGVNLYLTPREMAAFGQLYLDNGVHAGSQIVPSQWVADSTKGQGQVSYYGYMWWNDVNLNGKRGYRAWGWGKQFIYVFPSLDLVTVITHDTNGSGSVSDADLNNFVLDYVINAVTGSPGTTLDGDFNADGKVDAADFAVWRDGLNTRYTQNDYVLWRANFGKTAGSGAATANALGVDPYAVPEPAALAILLAAVLSGLFRRRRPRSHLT